MRNIYQSIWIESPYSIVQVMDVKMTEGMNSHTCLQITAICTDNEQNEFLNRPVEHEIVQAGHIKEGTQKKPFFTGRIQEISLTYEKGQMTVILTAISMTQAWDIVKRRRTFQNIDSTYEEVIYQVLSFYPNASWISAVNTKTKIPGFLLQYDETDWEFLCRLASHFEAYIMEEPSREVGQIYFGIPELNRGNEVDSDYYQISQSIDKYQQYAENVSHGMMLQDNLNWMISSRNAYKLGETVLWKYISCQIIRVCMKVRESEILYSYGLGRSAGVKSRYYGNRNISGLSLPATIRERNGNRLRVQFAIDPEYKAENNFYFTYAIETTSWYCLPEIGSTVHIYFQNWNEMTGIAVQAMRQRSIMSANSISAKGAVSDKSFSTADGKAMQFTNTEIIFASTSDASRLAISKDGTLNIDAKDITLCAQSKLNIGKGLIRIGEDVQEIIPKDTVLQSETGIIGLGILNFEDEEVSIAEDKGILIDESDNISLIASGILSYEPTQKDPPQIQYSDAELKKEDVAQREAHNAEVFEVREKESSGKINVGLIVAGIGIGCIVGALTVVSGGAALVAFGAGVTAYACGVSQVAEGTQDLIKMDSGDFSQSTNIVRDIPLGGSQELYETVMYGSVMIGLGALLSPLGKKVAKVPIKWLLAGQMLSAGGIATGTMYLQDIKDGYVDASWQEYLGNFGISSVMAGIGFGIGAGATYLGENSKLITSLLSKAGKYAPALIIGAETGIDVGVDWGTSKLFGREFDWKMSLLTALGSNIAFSIDPVNMATGGFCLTATDILLPDLIDEHFKLQRIYNSVIPCVGGLGKNWMLGLESRLFIQEQEGMIDVVCTDGHAERFELENGKWKNRRQGDSRYQLQKADREEGFILLYIPEHKWYNYDSMGRLISICGRGVEQANYPISRSAS